MNELILEKNNELPQGWEKIEFKKIIKNILLTGKKLKQKEYLKKGKLPVIDQGKDPIGGYTNDLNLKADYNLPVIVFGDHTKNIKFIEQEFIAGADGVKVLELKTPLNSKLIYYFIQAIPLPDKGYARHYQYLKKSIMYIPPLNEQKRIVLKIESIFAQIDATKEQLEMLVSKTKFVPGSLNTLRNSVLKQAFEGKLVPQDLNDEPAETLLKRISKDFKELILKNDRLPKGWTKTNVGQLYDIIGGGTPSTKIEKYWKGNIPWISSADIYDLYDIRPRRSITVEAVKSSATNLVPSESIIVVTRVGLGKIAYTKTPICFSQDSQALVGNNSIIDPHYALYYLSKAVQIFKYSNRGTTISGVTKKQLSELSFFLPPLNEQKRIVSKIESIFGNIDSIEKQVNGAIRSLNTLKQSVLKLAFEGKLVPQDPSDEPALVLLEKIKLQKK